ncbi:MAG: dTMP kinase [Candidatus Eisenbacteria bacterium]
MSPFIVFEGIEGCGKSTQIDLLATYLRGLKRACLITREPGGTPLGESLRELLLRWEGTGLDGLAELFLLEASRRVHVEQLILPALAGGTVVLSDRFSDSSVAYQGGGRGVDLDLIRRLNHAATGGLRADLTILLDLPAEAGLRRVERRDRAEDRLEREVLAFHERVREAYLDIARQGAPGFRVVDASQSREEIFTQILGCVDPLLIRDSSEGPRTRRPIS